MRLACNGTAAVPVGPRSPGLVGAATRPMPPSGPVDLDGGGDLAELGRHLDPDGGIGRVASTSCFRASWPTSGREQYAGGRGECALHTTGLPLSLPGWSKIIRTWWRLRSSGSRHEGLVILKELVGHVRPGRVCAGLVDSVQACRILPKLPVRCGRSCSVGLGRGSRRLRSGSRLMRGRCGIWLLRCRIRRISTSRSGSRGIGSGGRGAGRWSKVLIRQTFSSRRRSWGRHLSMTSGPG